VLAKWFEDFLELSKQIQILKGTEEDQAKNPWTKLKRNLINYLKKSSNGQNLKKVTRANLEIYLLENELFFLGKTDRLYVL